jgi:hypothetical protein
MAVSVNFVRSCDRCQKPWDVRRVSYAEGLPVVEEKTWVLTFAGKQMFSYNDLCPRCEGVMGKLVRQMRLDSDDNEEKKDAGPSTDETKKEDTAVPGTGDKDPSHPF